MLPAILTVLIILNTLRRLFSPTHPDKSAVGSSSAIAIGLVFSLLVWMLAALISTFLPHETTSREETHLAITSITLERDNSRPMYQVTAKSSEDEPLQVFEMPHDTKVFEDAVGDEGQMTRVVETKKLAAPFDVLVYPSFMPNGENEIVSFSEVHIPKGMLTQSQ